MVKVLPCGNWGKLEHLAFFPRRCASIRNPALFAIRISDLSVRAGLIVLFAVFLATAAQSAQSEGDRPVGSAQTPAGLDQAIRSSSEQQDVPAAANPDPLSPEAILGISIGDRPIHYLELKRYVEEVAARSDRVKLSTYWTTPTGRKLYLLTIASPGVLARLPEIERRYHNIYAAAADPDAADLNGLPLIAWMGYGIHGDEVSGPDAAVRLIHRLVTASDPHTVAMLEKLIIHVDPMVNPDGRERALANFTTYSHRSANLDEQDAYYGSIWPAGRGDHYLFDLNRDAVHLVTRSARARAAAIVKARPHILLDAHEMPDQTFMFAAPSQPFNPHWPSGIVQEWKDLTPYMADALGRDQQSFFRGSWNEVFYPGYFDIWPVHHGAIPVLLEQGWTWGATVLLKNGRVRTYAQGVDNQYRASLGVLEFALERDADLIRFRRTARLGSSGDGPTAWFVTPDDSYKAARIEQVLKTQGIAFERLAEASSVSSLRTIWNADAQTVRLPAGTLRIRVDQPLGRLIRNVFNFHTPMAANFIARERRSVELGTNQQVYDVTAWSLPLAYAADVYWSDRAASVGNWLSSSDGSGQQPRLAPARYGYFLRDPSLQSALRLLNAGVRVRVATRQIVTGGKEFAPGTILVRLDDQVADITAALASETDRGFAFQSIDASYVDEGPDLGGDEFVLLQTPRIGIFVGEPLDSYNVGAVWRHFDEEIGVPVSLLQLGQVGSLDFDKYNVLVLPNTDAPADVVARLGDEGRTALKAWLERGGTLIALGGGSLSLADMGMASITKRAKVLKTHPPTMLGRPAAEAIQKDFTAKPSGSSGSTGDAAWQPVLAEGALAFAGGTGAYRRPASPISFETWAAGLPDSAAAGSMITKYLPAGAYFTVRPKPMHWLRYGVADRLPAFFRQGDALIAGADAEVVARYGAVDELPLSGLIWPEAVGYVAETTYLARQSVGDGQMILFASDPVFRGYSVGTERFFMNAVVLGPGIAAK